MTLHQAILYLGILLIVMGAVFCVNSKKMQQAIVGFGRSRVADFLIFGSSAAWFIYKVAHLSAADEIGFISREVLLAVFITIAILALYYVPDFLSVRGLSILGLLLANELLHASWMQYSTAQIALNGFVYLMIIASLYLGAIPYKWRDHFTWLFKKNMRPRILGGAFLGYGIALLVLSTG